MTQSIERTGKSQTNEPTSTPEDAHPEQVGLSRVAAGQGAEPPPIQRSVEQLQTLPTEQLRQKALRSLGYKYGNRYTTQVMRQYHSSQDNLAANLRSSVVRTRQELPDEAELQAQINLELNAVEPVKLGDASEDSSEIQVPSVPSVPTPPAIGPVVKSTPVQSHTTAKVTLPPAQLAAKAPPPKLAKLAHTSPPKNSKELPKSATASQHLPTATDATKPTSTLNNFRSSVAQAKAKKADFKTSTPRLKIGPLHKISSLTDKAKTDLPKLSSRNRLGGGLARLMQQTGRIAHQVRSKISSIPTGRPVGGQIQRSSVRAPEQHPGFKLIKGQVKQAAKNQKTHLPAKTKAKQAQAAAQPPSNEKTTLAQTGQVDEMSQQQPKGFNKAAFVSALHQAIEAVAPQNQEEADNFKQSGKAGQVKGQVNQTVRQDKQESEKDIKEKTEASPDPSKAKGQPKQVVPMEAEATGATPVIPGAGAAMPTPKTEDEVSLQAGKTAVDQQMSQSNVTEEQLRKSNEPAFGDALKSKQAVETHADTAPAQFRAAENTTLQGAQQESQEKASKALTGMNAGRTAVLTGATSQQETAKSGDEAARAKVSQEIEARYNTTKTEASQILTALDGKVSDLFDKGEKTARDAFENYVDRRMTAYKKDRYDGITGGIQWGIDKLLGMPSEVNAFYQEGRSLYLRQMDGVIDGVADLVVGELNRAKARIEAGRQEIAKYISGLSPELKKVGEDAQQQIQGKFDQLDQDVDAKQDALVNDLAQKYVAARGAVDERINAMKDESKGLVSKATEAIGGVIQTIVNLKNMLLGVLSKAAGVIDKIISDPIGFLGNLISAVGAGLHKFVGNIGKHLKNGLMGWLFGALGDAGIQMPESLDLKGILHLVMQVLGLTYQNVRARAVAIVGEKTIGMIESGVDVFKKMITEGPIALWHLIQDKLTDLKDTVLGGIMDFVKDKIIQAGISWIIGLLSPAGAFIKACQAIYGIITFFIERGSQIMELVNAILNSVGAIASGAIGQAADFVENALGKAIPVTISFLANLLGLGGISDKIRKIIQKVQSPVNKAIDAVVKGIAKPFKKLMNSKFVTGLKNKARQGVDWAKNKVKAGADWAKGKAKGLLGNDKENNKGNTPKKEVELKKGVGAAYNLLQNEDLSAEEVKQKLPAIKSKYKLSTLELVMDSKNESEETDHIAGDIQRVLNSPKKKKNSGRTVTPQMLENAFKEIVKRYVDSRYKKTDDNALDLRLNIMRQTFEQVKGQYLGKKYSKKDLKDKISDHLRNARLLPDKMSDPTRVTAKGNREAPGATHQAHHIIPVEVVVASTHKFVQLALKGGWQVNQAQNGIMLPSQESMSNINGLRVHRGNHNKYTIMITSKLNDLVAVAIRDGWDDPNNISNCKRAAIALNNLIQELISNSIFIRGPGKSVRMK